LRKEDLDKPDRDRKRAAHGRSSQHRRCACCWCSTPSQERQREQSAGRQVKQAAGHRFGALLGTEREPGQMREKDPGRLQAQTVEVKRNQAATNGEQQPHHRQHVGAGLVAWVMKVAGEA